MNNFSCFFFFCSPWQQLTYQGNRQVNTIPVSVFPPSNPLCTCHYHTEQWQLTNSITVIELCPQTNHHIPLVAPEDSDASCMLCCRTVKTETTVHMLSKHLHGHFSFCCSSTKSKSGDQNLPVPRALCNIADSNLFLR